VDAGDNHSCGLRNGELWCWGGGAATPVRIGTGSTWDKVAVGGDLACAVNKADGQVMCGSTLFEAGQPIGPLRAIGVRHDVAAGKLHRCVLSLGGDLACWGLNNFGQLGVGGTGARLAPEMVGGPTQVWLDASPAEEHSCARANAGGFCWGRGHRGQLGTGHASRPLPSPVRSP
jgi:alpha-tubulin suppressor-like RCC1 family protein